MVERITDDMVEAEGWVPKEALDGLVKAIGRQEALILYGMAVPDQRQFIHALRIAKEALAAAPSTGGR